jgi:hypothetical protein
VPANIETRKDKMSDDYHYSRNYPPPPHFFADQQALRAAREQHAYRAAAVEWVAGFIWAHVITLTTEYPHRIRRPWGTESIWKLVTDYIRGLGGRAGGRVPYIAVLEFHADGETLHAHLLIDGTAHLSCEQLERAWQEGRAHVEVFDPSRSQRAAAYITKTLPGAEEDMWRVSRRGFRTPQRDPCVRASSGGVK